MSCTKSFFKFAAAILLLSSLTNYAAAKNGQPAPTPTPTPAGPPAPVLVAPASGASVVQPITLGWNAVSPAGGPIGSYTWQVGTTSAFTTIIASGFTDIDNDPTIPTPTTDKVSGLPNGTYFWRVSASQTTVNGGVNSAWSAVRTFTVTGPGLAPAAPSFLTPANNAQFHLVESFKISWSAVPGAQYYVLEADDEPSFSYPFTLSQSPITFGTQFGGMWGNALTAYYRVRAVSADGVRSLPSATLTVRITNAAPVPAGVTQVSPAAGASVALPFFFDWTDTPNPQVPGYEIDVNTSSTFADTSSALSVTPTRSDYMITRDLLAPGNYFWRVRALHGNVAGPWSAARPITVTAGPTPPNVNLFAIIAEPINGYGGNSVQARVMLDNPAPAGGAIITLSTDLPQAQMPSTTITVPAGKTDAVVSPILTGPVPNNGLSIGIIGDLFAGFGSGREQNSLGILPIFYGTGLSNESVVGGTSVTGTVTLLNPAPPGGTTIRLVSGNSNLVRPPATVFIPAGATDASFIIATSAVSSSVRVYIDSGTDVDGFRAPQDSIVLTPPGSPTPAVSLSSLTLGQPAIFAGNSVTGTVTLTSPAPAGGTVVTLSASANGQQIAPANVTVPAGNSSANFTTAIAPPTHAPYWVLVQAHCGTSGGSQGRLLEIDPASGAPTLLAIGPAGQDVIGGNPGRASVALIMPAPAGGGVVNLTTDNPTYIHVPASVSIPEGNSVVSFTVGTSAVATLPTGGNIFASAGGVTKSIFVNVAPDPNAPPILRSISITPASVAGGTSATGTIFLNSPAPASGTEATLATSNTVASPQPIVTVPAGQTSANFNVRTSAVTTNTVVTITAIVGAATQTANLTVTKGPAPTPTPTPLPTATPMATPTPAPTATPTGPLAAPAMVGPAADARFTPGTNITFDWSDVNGAASYTIQVDDQNTFSSPVVNQTVTTSQFSTSTLPTQTMWWRVRAHDASNNAGAWSAVRRFEVKK
jgi:hypothetical protein